MSSASISKIIKERRSVFPVTYTEEQIPDEVLFELLENAHQAPNHRKTEPWRFVVLQNEGRNKLADFMAEWYKENTPEAEFSAKKYTKLGAKPLKAQTIIAICMKRDEEERVPEWEEIAAVAMAVQNMWLTCTEKGLGCYWSSPKAALFANEVLGLQKGERCLGLFYLGYHTMPEVPSQRGDFMEKVRFIR